MGQRLPEFGTALGIAVLGTLHPGLYRGGMDLPPSVPAGATAAAMDSLSGARTAVDSLPDAMADSVLHAAQSSFVDAVAVTAGVAAVIVTAAAAAAFLTLPRHGSELDRE